MHRSGTSLVSGMLSLMGVQMYTHGMPREEGGRIIVPSPHERMNGYAEAEPFYLMNERVLGRAQATWDFVDPFLQVRDESHFAESSVAVLEAATFTSLKWDYLDKFPGGVRGLWGWKDPRNSLTLRYWLELFPEARVLHVLRGAEEVTDSLQRRARKWREENPGYFRPSLGQRVWRLARDPQALARSIGKRTGLYHPVARPRVTVEDTAYCLRLWDQYVDSCRRFKWLGTRFLEVKYEDVVTDSDLWSGKLAAFCGITPSPEQLQAAAGLVETPKHLQHRLSSDDHRGGVPVRPGLARRSRVAQPKANPEPSRHSSG